MRSTAIDADSGSARILVIDDNEATRRLLALEFEELGFEVGQAASVEQALQSARDHAPDVILLDYVLPDADGGSALEQLRASTPAHIILLTAMTIPAAELQRLHVAPEDYVLKPFDTEQLAARVRAVLRD